MVSQTNEAALETHIENALAKDGYRIADPADFERAYAVRGKHCESCHDANLPGNR